MNTISRFAAFALIAVSPTFALAQDAGKAQPATKPAADVKPEAKAADTTIDPAAEKLITASKDAVKKIRDISYKVKQNGDAGMGDMASQGHVTVSIPEKVRGFPIEHYKVAIHDEKGKATSEWAMNGKQLQKVDHATKKLLTMEIKGGMNMPPQDLWPILPQWIFEDLFANPMMKLQSAVMLPDAEVAGVKCKVVKYVQVMEMPMEDDMGEGEKKDDKAEKKAAPKMVSTNIKYLGVDDNLPRKFENSTKIEGGDEAMGGQSWGLKGEMTEMKVNAGLKAEDFAFKAPEGYAAEVGTADNMGMQSEEQAPELKAKPGSDALDFKLSDPTGKEVTLASLKGRVVLLDFWATWCGPCKQAMPSIQKLHEKYKDKPVTIIGVNCWEKSDKLAIDYMAKKDFTYTLLLKGDDLAKAYGVSGIPTFILIDTEGKVLHAASGFSDGEEEHLAEMIDKALAKK